MSAVMVMQRPGQGMTLGPVTPPTDQERVRLLLGMKDATDFYDLHFVMAEHSGFVRGLFMAGHISASMLVMFQAEARRVAQAAADRLAWVTQ